MTIQEIIDTDKLVLTPGEIAPILGCDAQDIRVQAKQHPERLGFSVAVIGSRVKIPKMAFLKWLGFTEGKDNDAN